MKMPFTANPISFHVLGFFLMILWFHTICKIHFYCLPVFRYRHRLGFLIYLHVGNILGIILSVYLFTVINEEKHPSKEIFLFTEHLCCPLQVWKSVRRQECVSVDGWGQQVPFSPALSLKADRLLQQMGWRYRGLTQACSRASSDQKFSRKNCSMEEWRILLDSALVNIWFLFPQHICFHLVSFFNV